MTYATWRLLMMVYGKKGAKAPDPLTIPRPGARQQEPTRPTREDFRRALLGGG